MSSVQDFYLSGAGQERSERYSVPLDGSHVSIGPFPFRPRSIVLVNQTTQNLIAQDDRGEQYIAAQSIGATYGMGDTVRLEAWLDAAPSPIQGKASIVVSDQPAGISAAQLSSFAAIGGAAAVGDYACLQDQQAPGTSESSAGGVGAFATRTLNTIAADPKSIVKALAANRFTLDAGTYVINAVVPVYQSGRARARLRNVTNGTTPLGGTNAFGVAGNASLDASHIKGMFIVAANGTQFEIQMRVTGADASGFGVDMNTSWPPDPAVEIYTSVDLWKIA